MISVTFASLAKFRKLFGNFGRLILFLAILDGLFCFGNFLNLLWQKNLSYWANFIVAYRQILNKQLGHVVTLLPTTRRPRVRIPTEHLMLAQTIVSFFFFFFFSPFGLVNIGQGLPRNTLQFNFVNFAVDHFIWINLTRMIFIAMLGLARIPLVNSWQRVVNT